MGVVCRGAFCILLAMGAGLLEQGLRVCRTPTRIRGRRSSLCSSEAHGLRAVHACMHMRVWRHLGGLGLRMPAAGGGWLQGCSVACLSCEHYFWYKQGSFACFCVSCRH